ncbi:sulfatase-like hydrolase/transferase [Sandarakinorhabdus sp. AAP62]|uniref:sulfatase-like hydrolase/transferase n=1 Tax=Sandarakinorhabdus sp. AAP62 TaxID=1248916 RepID=UPI000302EF4F|nr:sulfatase-like hydrolase/transferase [Sandarakinorhabdus sp. AAP62]
MFKRIGIVGLVAVLLLAGVGWFNRAAIVQYIALNQAAKNRIDAGPTQTVPWNQGPAETAAPQAERPPNIVFILLDDLGYNDITTFGGGIAGGRVPTPNIDRLAAQGAIFSQAYSGTGTCAPSRAMLMTGRYPTRTGFEFTPTPNGMTSALAAFASGRPQSHLPGLQVNPAIDDDRVPFADKGLPGSEITIAELLKQRGYHTVHIGKWHLGNRREFLPNAQGFDESLLMHSGLYLPEDDPQAVNARLDFDPIDKFLWAALSYAASFNGGKPFKPAGYLTDWWTDETMRVIEANKNRPFFLYLAHWAPHTPLQATRADFEAVGDITPHRERVYAAMIRALDRSVGRVLDKLEAEGLADNTIVVLSSDNGGAGYVGLPQVNAPFRGWKITLFEGGIRVPMFVRWPGRIAPGTVVKTPVAHIDLFPSLASAAGAALPADRVIDGVNIMPAAFGNAPVKRKDDAIFWQSGAYRVVRAGDWKLQVDGNQNKLWLFNLASDPGEKANLATSQPQKVAQLKALLAAHHANAVPSLWPHSLISPVLLDKTINQAVAKGDEYILWPN